MKPRLLLNLFLAAVVAVLGTVVWRSPAPKETAHPLSALKAEAVQRIHIEKPGQPPLALEKSAGRWRITAPFSARADEARIGRLLGLLSAVSAERFPAVDLGRFELDHPLLSLTLGSQRFDFGALNPLTQQQYVATNGSVYLINPQLAADAYAQAFELADKKLLADNEQPVGFDLPGLKLERDAEGKWNAPRFGQDALNRYADEWKNTYALMVQPYDGTKPLQTLRLRLADGRTIDLAVLQEQPDFILLRQDQKLQYHFPPELKTRLLQPK